MRESKSVQVSPNKPDDSLNSIRASKDCLVLPRQCQGEQNQVCGGNYLDSYEYRFSPGQIKGSPKYGILKYICTPGFAFPEKFFNLHLPHPLHTTLHEMF